MNGQYIRDTEDEVFKNLFIESIQESIAREPRIREEEKNNPKELFDKLSLLFNNLENAKAMGKKGKEFVKNNFNWDKICNDFLNHLKKHGISDM